MWQILIVQFFYGEKNLCKCIKYFVSSQNKRRKMEFLMMYNDQTPLAEYTLEFTKGIF